VQDLAADPLRGEVTKQRVFAQQREKRPARLRRGSNQGILTRRGHLGETPPVGRARRRLQRVEARHHRVAVRRGHVPLEQAGEEGRHTDVGRAGRIGAGQNPFRRRGEDRRPRGGERRRRGDGGGEDAVKPRWREAQPGEGGRADERLAAGAGGEGRRVHR